MINISQYPLNTNIIKLSTRCSPDMDNSHVSVEKIIKSEIISNISNNLNKSLTNISNKKFVKSNKSLSDNILLSDNKYLVCAGSMLNVMSPDFIYGSTTKDNNPYFHLRGKIFDKKVYINNYLPHNVVYLIDGIDLYESDLKYCKYSETDEHKYNTGYLDYNFNIKGNIESIYFITGENDPNYKEYLLSKRVEKIGKILNK